MKFSVLNISSFRFKIKSPIGIQWVIFSLLCVGIVLLPITFLVGAFFEEVSPSWQNIRTYALNPTIINTVIIVFMSAFFSAVVGTTLAIIMSIYNFKGRRILHPLIILPLAIPPYISAFTYANFLGFTGPVQSFLRNSMGIFTTFSIMNIHGAVFIFTITLYPYVYLISRSYIKNNGGALLENARLLGRNNLYALIKIVVPLLIPSIITGTTFVALETVNDFGIANYFGIRTLSTLIFQAWYFMYDINLSLRISLVLVAFIAVYLFIGKLLSKDNRYKLPQKPITPIRLNGIGLLIIIFPVVVILISFIIPVLYMIFIMESINFNEIFVLSVNTITIASISTFIIIFISLFVANTSRFVKTSPLFKLASIGYAIPSPVLAIGIISLFVSLDNNGLLFGHTFTFSSVMLIFAYCIKYFKSGYGNIEKGFTKVGLSYTEGSRTLGHNIIKTLFKVDVFTIKNSIISGSILIFIELVKELPLTLILRSFNFQSLSTRVYMFAINEQIPKSAPYSLAIILICSVFVVIISFIDEGKINGKIKN